MVVTKAANKQDAANPAIASRLHGGCPWRGVADTGRSADEHTENQYDAQATVARIQNLDSIAQRDRKIEKS